MSTTDPPEVDPENLRIRTIVFTDLDGTLLDARYDLISAAAAMDALSRLDALVVPVSSKTLPELEVLAAHRRIAAPMIFENGAGLAWPAGFELAKQADEPATLSVEVFGRAYVDLCAILQDLRTSGGYLFRGFADMCAAEISKRTGLTEPAATLAKQRRASEPITWADTSEQYLRFEQSLRSFDLQLQHGGRFSHVMPLHDKGQAATRVIQTYQQASAVPLRIIACGDSPNDQPLLALADACVLFPQANGRYLTVSPKPVYRASKAGDEHWLRAVTQLLEDLTRE